MLQKKQDKLLAHISEEAFKDEKACVEELLSAVEAFSAVREPVQKRASEYIRNIRNSPSKSGMEEFIHQFGLKAREGVMIMCLAEALLRIPDRETANQLIEDSFKDTNWENYIGSSRSLFGHASVWGLVLTGEIIQLGQEGQGSIGKVLGKMTSNLGEPVIREALRAAMKLLGNQFVLGSNLKEALKHASSYYNEGYQFSFDMLGEGARTYKQADEYFEAYSSAIERITERNFDDSSLSTIPNVSIKLTGLHPHYTLLNEEEVMEELLPKAVALAKKAKEQGIWISIDAEETWRLDVSLKLFAALISDPAFKGYDGIGYVLQAYQKPAILVIDFLESLAKDLDKTIPVRLVKGAYWDTEIKHAQVEGLPNYPVFTRKSHTDVSYMACAERLLEAGCFYPQFATHNALTAASIIEFAGDKEYEFQRLYGMGKGLFKQLLREKPCRVYAPVGRFKELLPYLIRRLLENGANSSFVNQLMDPNEPLQTLITNPEDKAKENLLQDTNRIPLPKDIYLPSRLNSPGYSLGHRCHLQILEKAISAKPKYEKLKDSTPKDIEKALATAHEAYLDWEKTPAETRSYCLEQMADQLIKHRDEFLNLLVKEAKKTLDTAIAEWREAIDFCYYYANQCLEKCDLPIVLPSPTGETNHLHMRGRGVFVCISPWNFPLAIFLGQVTAALAAGNTVIAKPAEQTPQVAKFAVDLLYKAGIPKDTLHLILGNGEETGPPLINDKRTKGIAFTGSTNVAKIIQKQLAEREGEIIPLIAETGGLNCMMVDSTALLEHTVDDVIDSAFKAAGQRCSALRVLYVQSDIADKFLNLFKDAMDTIHVDDPAKLSTDVGPVIDDEAKENIEKHIKKMKKSAKLIAEAKVAKDAEGTDSFVAPIAFELESIDDLDQEIFGPVLHVVRYKAKNFVDVIHKINDKGYGLTFGLQSRISEKTGKITEHVHVGNMYVNRGMTGAVVGVQPFGGEGLSGTGFKAGGPHYLLRFMTERVVTNNITAIGGNISLLT